MEVGRVEEEEEVERDEESEGERWMMFLRVRCGRLFVFVCNGGSEMEGRQEGGVQTHPPLREETSAGFQPAITHQAGLRPTFTWDAKPTRARAPLTPPLPVASIKMACDDEGGLVVVVGGGGGLRCF